MQCRPGNNLLIWLYTCLGEDAFVCTCVYTHKRKEEMIYGYKAKYQNIQDIKCHIALQKGVLVKRVKS